MKSWIVKLVCSITIAFAGFGVARLFKYLVVLDTDTQLDIVFVAGFVFAYFVYLISAAMHGKHLVLESAEIGVPGGGKFVVAVPRQHKQASWIIFTELITRVGANKLPEGVGVSESAMQSIYDTFTRIRTLVGDSGPSKGTGDESLETISFRLLNSEFRPFLTKWHGRKIGEDGNFIKEDQQFRKELNSMSDRIIKTYAVAYARLSGVKNPIKLLDQSFPQMDGPDDL